MHCLLVLLHRAARQQLDPDCFQLSSIGRTATRDFWIGVTVKEYSQRNFFSSINPLHFSLLNSCIPARKPRSPVSRWLKRCPVWFWFPKIPCRLYGNWKSASPDSAGAIATQNCYGATGVKLGPLLMILRTPRALTLLGPSSARARAAK